MYLPVEILHQIIEKSDDLNHRKFLYKVLKVNPPKSYYKMYFSSIISGIFITCFECNRPFVQQENHFGYDECSRCFTINNCISGYTYSDIETENEGSETEDSETENVYFDEDEDDSSSDF